MICGWGDGSTQPRTDYYRDGTKVLYNWTGLHTTEYSLRIGGSDGAQIAAFTIDMSTGAAELRIDCR